jgi:hypothetical protein
MGLSRDPEMDRMYFSKWHVILAYGRQHVTEVLFLIFGKDLIWHDENARISYAALKITLSHIPHLSPFIAPFLAYPKILSRGQRIHDI